MSSARQAGRYTREAGKESVNGSYRVLSSQYLTSVHSIDALNSSEVPEIAFLGRSNVGKSSLLNALCERKGLAVTSKTPGRTRALNFFEVVYRHEDSSNEPAKRYCHFVDLPGFGFAQVSKKMQSSWMKLVESYLMRRPNLCAVVLLNDSRRKPQAEEQWIADFGRDGNLFVAMTKADKIKKNELQAKRREIREVLQLSPEQIFPVSVVGKKRMGVTELRNRLFGSCTV